MRNNSCDGHDMPGPSSEAPLLVIETGGAAGGWRRHPFDIYFGLLQGSCLSSSGSTKEGGGDPLARCEGGGQMGRSQVQATRGTVERRRASCSGQYLDQGGCRVTTERGRDVRSPLAAVMVAVKCQSSGVDSVFSCWDQDEVGTCSGDEKKRRDGPWEAETASRADRSGNVETNEKEKKDGSSQDRESLLVVQKGIEQTNAGRAGGCRPGSRPSEMHVCRCAYSLWTDVHASQGTTFFFVSFPSLFLAAVRQRNTAMKPTSNTLAQNVPRKPVTQEPRHASEGEG